MGNCQSNSEKQGVVSNRHQPKEMIPTTTRCHHQRANQSNSNSIGPKNGGRVAAESSSGRFRYKKGACALEYWEPIGEIGQGSISFIHLVRRRPERIDIPYKHSRDIMSFAKETQDVDQSMAAYTDADVRVLKSIHKQYVHNDVYLDEMRNEIRNMSHVRHPNIATVYEAYERKRHIYLIMEYCSGGSLWELVDNDDIDKQPLTEEDVAILIHKILDAVAYLHEHNIVHRDLKLENILLDRDGELKIVDFGLATRYLKKKRAYLTDRVGTLYCMEPRIIEGIPYDSKCDIWSIGVIAYILLSGGTQPFWGNVVNMPWEQRRKVMMARIRECKYTKMIGPVWNKVSPEAKDFVKQLLQLDPTERPKAEESLKHPWLQQRYVNMQSQSLRQSTDQLTLY